MYTVKVNGQTVSVEMVSLAVAIKEYQMNVRAQMKAKTSALVELIDHSDPSNPVYACHAN